MGIDFALVRFFDHCAELTPIDGPMLALGSLTLRESEPEIEAFARKHSYDRLLREKDVASLMQERYGIARYVSCDINGLADIELDFSKELPAAHRGAYASILNGGTLEHILDIQQALENIHDATRKGGLMLHTTPVTWFDHGYFNINPALFHMLAAANGYETVAEGYYFCAGSWPGQVRPEVIIKDVDATAPGFGAAYNAIFSGRSLPALAMHLACLRKTLDAPFRTPVQVSH